MSEDTTDLSYWLNWKFFSCAALVLISIVFGAILIWKFEGPRRPESEEREDQQQGRVGLLYKDELWNTCLRGIHPAWLLGFRIIGFVVLFSLITGNLVVDSAGIMYYYTQWTFTLVTLYSALGCSMSMYGLYTSCNGLQSNHTVDRDRGTYVAVLGESAGMFGSPKSMDIYREPHHRETAGFSGYVFQIVFQVCAGAVVITDAMFWFVIFPFLTEDDYKLDFFNGCMHSVNAAFLLGDTFLNCLRFPMFRFGYFVLWTSIYVIFQWIVHACVSLWWPYPFLDFTFPYAALWYLGVAILHIPCYGIFALVVRLKNFWLSRSFPEAYQGSR